MVRRFDQFVESRIARITTDVNSVVFTFDDSRVISVVQLDDYGHEFLCCITLDGKTSVANFKYDKYFASIQLPAEESTLKRLYDNFTGDFSKTFYGLLFREWTNLTELHQYAGSEKEQSDEKWKEFYTRILLPAFMKFENTNKIDLSEADTQRLIQTADIKIGGHEMFPQKSHSATSSSTKLPEELPKFDDEYELQRRKDHEDIIQRSSSSPYAPIGDRDLHPFGQYPPMRPHLGPDAGSPSGMIPDRNHPLFRQGPGAASSGSRGDHPPGSRYDDPLGRDDFDAVGKGLPGGMGLGGSEGAGPFGGSNPFGRSGGFGGGFGGGFV